MAEAIEATLSPKARDVMQKGIGYGSLHFLSRYSEMMFRVGIFNRSLKNQLREIQKLYPNIKSIEDVPTKHDDAFVDKNGNHIIQKYVYAKAVNSARGILDFNQGGTAIKEAENFIPYINAATQGARVAVQKFKRRPLETTSKILQIVGLSSAAFTAMAIGLIKAFSDDDDDRTAIDIYLDFRATLSPTEKNGYFTIPYAYGEEAGTYKYLRLARSQQLIPIFAVVDGYIENTMRANSGKKTISQKQIWSNAAESFSQNYDPTGLSGIPLGLATGGVQKAMNEGAKVATKNPLMKGVLTYASGYDYFFQQPLQDTEQGTVHQLEGSRSGRVEDFYKSLGLSTGASPIRTKAAIEGLITSPNTNYFVGIMYGGLDTMTEDVSFKDALKKFAGYNDKGEWKPSKMPVANRLMRETTPYGRQLNIAKEIKESPEFKAALLVDGKAKALSDKIAKKYGSIDAVNADWEKVDKEITELVGDDAITYNKIAERISNKIKNKDMDGAVWDIAYSTGTSYKAKAMLILSYFGDVTDNEKIQQDLKEARVWSKNVQYEYYELLKTKSVPK